jgi:hypothetical protein
MLADIFAMACLFLGCIGLIGSFAYFRRSLRLRKSGAAGKFSLWEFLFRTKPFMQASGNQLLGEGVIVVVASSFLLYVGVRSLNQTKAPNQALQTMTYAVTDCAFAHSAPAQVMSDL